MGLVFGKIKVETPKFEVVKSTTDYEIRKYIPAVIAEVTYNVSQFKGDADGGFKVLANYIGAFGKPQNSRPEKIAMTSPVITQSRNTIPEKIAMTVPVITQSRNTIPEKISMTSPVITQSRTQATTNQEEEKTKKAGDEMVMMQFVLPSKYTKAEEAPKPIDEMVVIKEEGERKYGVVTFSGVASGAVVEEKAEKLKKGLEKDGHKVTGEFLLARYNPPWLTLPMFRTNEIMIPIE